MDIGLVFIRFGVEAGVTVIVVKFGCLAVAQEVVLIGYFICDLSCTACDVGQFFQYCFRCY